MTEQLEIDNADQIEEKKIFKKQIKIDNSMKKLFTASFYL